DLSALECGAEARLGLVGAGVGVGHQGIGLRLGLRVALGELLLRGLAALGNLEHEVLARATRLVAGGVDVRLGLLAQLRHLSGDAVGLLASGAEGLLGLGAGGGEGLLGLGTSGAERLLGLRAGGRERLAGLVAGGSEGLLGLGLQALGLGLG